jgi:tRNA(fMet)-specific endonuclease VapC
VDYLLDTNACIALINGSPAAVRSRFQTAAKRGSQIFVSAVVVFELWYGVTKSSRRGWNAERLETFLAGPVTILPFEEEDAKLAGSIRASLETSDRPIGAYDVLIAGQAIASRLTLVTANVSEFSRVKDLVWQDWAKTS